MRQFPERDTLSGRRRNTMMQFRIRQMQQQDWSEVADLICVSTNFWYQAQGKPPIFQNGPDATRLFCEVYESLDPGCTLLAEHPVTGRLMGSCFYHPRETHYSLGIMNAHPNYFGSGVARQLLGEIVRMADAEKKPVRLVSSAMNLDSYSLYTRAGFVPRQAFQDMYLSVPADGVATTESPSPHVRDATENDIPAIAALEQEVSGIRREKDYRLFIENQSGYWHAAVYVDDGGHISGFIASIIHPGSNMIGPGFARDEAIAGDLLLAELNRRCGNTPVFLVPVDCRALVERAYGWGARNCELHFAQIRGDWQPYRGVVLPTFMPETG
jgi:GNAT superfamily N-acetyltransferase